MSQANDVLVLRRAILDWLRCNEEFARALDSYNVAVDNFDDPICEADALDRACKQLSWAENNARAALDATA